MPDRIATDLLRVALDPVTGRLRYPSSLEVALRAALFAELAFDGYLVDENNAPSATIGEPSDDRVFVAICQAVRQRPNVMWRRWFNHVRGDRIALSKELVEAGRWERRPGRRPAFTDKDAPQAQALAFELNRIATFDRSPKDSREAALALLGVACGAIGRRPRPAAVRRELKSILDGIDNFTAMKVVGISAIVIRRTRRGLALGR